MRQPNHGRGGLYHIGRVRVALAKYLTEHLGCRVDPTDLIPATGAYRTQMQLDTYPWELLVNNDGGHVRAGCWLTMTAFLKQAKAAGGCHITGNEIWPNKHSGEKVK